MANTIPPPIPTDRSSKHSQGAGLMDYLKAAFFFRWNLLFFLGGLAAAAIAPLPDVTIPIVLAGELAYLGALTSIPRFRAAIDAKVHSAQGTASTQPTTEPSLVVMLAGLPGEARSRFERLHSRCVEMRHLAVGMHGGHDPRHDSGRSDDPRKPAEPEGLRAAADTVQRDVKGDQRHPGEESHVIFGEAVRKKNAGRGGKKDQADRPLTHRANLAEGEGCCN